MPLAVITHLSREPADLTLEQARDAAEGAIDDWADLGAGPGRLRVVSSVDDVAEDPDAVAVVPADDSANAQVLVPNGLVVGLRDRVRSKRSVSSSSGNTARRV